MKTKIKYNNKINEVEVRNLLHFEIQKNTKSIVFKNKKKYNRKQKHRNKIED